MLTADQNTLLETIDSSKLSMEQSPGENQKDLFGITVSEDYKQERRHFKIEFSPTMIALHFKTAEIKAAPGDEEKSDELIANWRKTEKPETEEGYSLALDRKIKKTGPREESDILKPADYKHFLEIFGRYLPFLRKEIPEEKLQIVKELLVRQAKKSIGGLEGNRTPA